MRKIILDLAVSLDGYIEGPNGEFDWCIMDEDMDFEGFLSSIDTIFYGRVSYELWSNYQPDPTASELDLKLWETIHSKQKYIFSKHHRAYPNATLIQTDIAEAINQIKNQAGKDIWLYGGANLIKTFLQLELIDLFRLSVHPVVLGSGKPLFEDLKERLNLKLVESKPFKSGVVQLIYEPIQ